MKKCRVCSETKDLDQFNKKQTQCKQCQNAYVKQHYQKNKKRYFKNNIISSKKWQTKNQEHLKSYRKQRNEGFKDGHYSVYLLPDHNYVGQTGGVERRMFQHQNKHSRNTDNVRILYTTKSKDEALELEALLHDMGYEGAVHKEKL